MAWNWQQSDWPNFSYDATALDIAEREFLLKAGEYAGAVRHFDVEERNALRIELLGEEAIKTSAIEGEMLDRESVQSSLRQQFGWETTSRAVPPREHGISAMMVDLHANFAEPLSHGALHAWHEMVMAGSRMRSVGSYRSHADPMQVVSGSVGDPRIHFEAPPSARVKPEMDRFVSWFNETAPAGTAPLPPVRRAGLAHLYFESIHPFEDGNGRIGRALSEKVLAQSLGRPSLIALADTIERRRNVYYERLEANNKTTEVTDWLRYFATTVIEAQDRTLQRVEFSLARARFYQARGGLLNPRQGKVLARMFAVGVDGFKGGLSAENYIAVAKTSRASATRDLQDLVAKGALVRTGQLRHARYWLNLEPNDRE